MVEGRNIPQQENRRSPESCNKNTRRKLFYVPPIDVPPSVFVDAVSKTRAHILEERETTLQGIDNSVLRILSGSAQAPHEMLGLDLSSIQGFEQWAVIKDPKAVGVSPNQPSLEYPNANSSSNKKQNSSVNESLHLLDTTNLPAANLENGTFHRYKYLVPGGIAELRSRIMSEKGKHRQITKVCDDMIKFWGRSRIGHSQILDDFLPFVSDSSKIAILGRGALLSEIVSQTIKIHTGARFYVMEGLPEMPHETLVRLQHEQQNTDNNNNNKRGNRKNQPSSTVSKSKVDNADSPISGLRSPHINNLNNNNN
eukprot:Tbor_TRINITY_DN5641_c3_g1::TRINITY_DN5641_c3_g1_i1::g.8708::m.8708